MKQRLLMLLIALDVFVFAVITLGGSKRNETISSALWSLERDAKWQGIYGRPVVDWLFAKVERNHCETAWLIENKQALWNHRYD